MVAKYVSFISNGLLTRDINDTLMVVNEEKFSKIAEYVLQQSIKFKVTLNSNC